MRRKVSKIGSSTLMVSLPSKWCKANQVRKGDEMELEVTDTAITILPKEKQLALKSTAINVSGLSPSMVKRILAVYHKVGHDEVEVRFENAEQFHLVRERIKDMLIGYEIIEQSKNKCLIKYISGEGKTECGPVLRRLPAGLGGLLAGGHRVAVGAACKRPDVAGVAERRAAGRRRLNRSPGTDTFRLPSRRGFQGT